MWALSAIQSIVATQLPPNTDADAELARAAVHRRRHAGQRRCWSGLRRRCRRRGRSWSTRSRTARAARPASAARRFRATLIVAEVALSVVLLVGSSLLLVSFLKLQRTPPGFEAEGRGRRVCRRARRPLQDAGAAGGLLRRRWSTGCARSPGSPARRRRSACRSRASTRARRTASRGRPVLPLPQRPLAGLAIVSDDYFRLMRITLAAGRAFTADDREGAPGVCIVNESLAKRLFPGEIGARQGAAARPRRRDRGPKSSA